MKEQSKERLNITGTNDIDRDRRSQDRGSNAISGLRGGPVVNS